MPIDIAERYKLVLDRHRWISELRVKMVAGWLAIYAALGVVFTWLEEHHADWAWLSAAGGALVAVFMWIADRRHRGGLHATMRAGSAIEAANEAGIAPDQRVFWSQLPTGCWKKLWTYLTSHSSLIDAFAGLAFIFCAYGAYRLYFCYAAH